MARHSNSVSRKAKGSRATGTKRSAAKGANRNVKAKGKGKKLYQRIK